MILITTTGAKTGRQLTSPLVHTTDADGNHVIIASMGGAPKDPNWYHNIKANPEVKVEAAGDSYTARAETTEGDDRQALYDAQAAKWAQFSDYKAKAAAANRVIPVIRLQRA